MRKLTKREVVLLYILGCLSVVLIGWMALAMPALEKANQARANAAEAKSSLQTLKINQAGLADIEGQAKKLILDVESLVTKFSGSVDNEVLDKQLTTLAQKYYLKPVDLTISERETVSIVNLEKRYEMLENDEQLPTTQDGKPKGTKCDVMYITMRVTGTQANAASLAQEVSTYPTIRLNGMVVDNVLDVVTLEFAVYFMPTEDK